MSNVTNDFYMYWTDIVQDQMNHNNVFIFGKVPITLTSANDQQEKMQFFSCCVRIPNMHRVLYFLERNNVNVIQDTEGNEEKAIVKEVREKVMQNVEAKNVKYKHVQRMYCFPDNTVPKKGNYLKVSYDSRERHVISTSMMEGKTYSRVFGSTMSAMDYLILKRKLKGPGWIKVTHAIESTSHRNLEKGKMAAMQQFSWCQREVTVNCATDVHKCITVQQVLPRPAPPVPMCLVSIALQCGGNDNSEISSVSIVKFDISDVNNARSMTTMINPSSMITVKSLSSSLSSQTKQQATTTSTKSSKGPLYSSTSYTLPSSSCEQHTIKYVKNERELLSFMINKIQGIDPDGYIGHNLVDQDLGLIMQRIQQNSISHVEASKLGRLRRNQFFRGRLLCDTLKFAMQHISAKSYSLKELSLSVLKTKLNLDVIDNSKNNNNNNNANFNFNNDSDTITLTKAILCAHLCFFLGVLPLTKQLSIISGLPWSSCLLRGQNMRTDYLLMYEFYRLKYICPELCSNTLLSVSAPIAKTTRTKNITKLDDNKKKEDNGDNVNNEEEDMIALDQQQIREEEDDDDDRKRKNNANTFFVGGLVLEPKIGLYDKSLVLLLDFKSLYPSIIQEYNICFQTPQGSGGGGSSSNGSDDDDSGGVLPMILSRLVNLRQEIKHKRSRSQDETEKFLLDIEQKAIKLTANAIYGCLGCTQSKFYAKEIASRITEYGRQILQDAVKITEMKFPVTVIFGDTDSIMIDSKTNSLDECMKLAKSIMDEINKGYSILRLDISDIFHSTLLLKKKKYVAMKLILDDDNNNNNNTNIKPNPNPNSNTDRDINSITGITEHDYCNYGSVLEEKGVEMIRRDWCPLAKNIGRDIVSFILSKHSRECKLDEIFSYLSYQMIHVLEDPIDVHEFVITKQLQAPMVKYNNAQNLVHVQAAMRLRKLFPNIQNSTFATPSMFIEYVICNQTTLDNSSASSSLSSLTSTTTIPNKAVPLDEYVSKASSLPSLSCQIDRMWYWKEQVMPLVSRLCEPITGVTNILHTQPYHFNPAIVSIDCVNDDTFPVSAMFYLCEKLHLVCLECKCDFALSTLASQPQLSTITCPKCNNIVSLQGICESMTKQLSAMQSLTNNNDESDDVVTKYNRQVQYFAWLLEKLYSFYDSNCIIQYNDHRETATILLELLQSHNATKTVYCDAEYKKYLKSFF